MMNIDKKKSSEKLSFKEKKIREFYKVVGTNGVAKRIKTI